jgi:hypothetical protein
MSGDRSLYLRQTGDLYPVAAHADVGTEGEKNEDDNSNGKKWNFSRIVAVVVSEQRSRA